MAPACGRRSETQGSKSAQILVGMGRFELPTPCSQSCGGLSMGEHRRSNGALLVTLPARAVLIDGVRCWFQMSTASEMASGSAFGEGWGASSQLSE